MKYVYKLQNNTLFDPIGRINVCMRSVWKQQQQQHVLTSVFLYLEEIALAGINLLNP